MYSTCDVRINASCYFCDLFLLMGEGYAPRHPEVSFFFLVGVGRGDGFCVWCGQEMELELELGSWKGLGGAWQGYWQ